MKILVIQQKMIGDVLTSSILFESLRKKYPEAELHFLIYPNTRAVVENNPYIDKLIEFDPEYNCKIIGFLGFLRKIKAASYDVVIDVYSKISTGIIAKFSGAQTRISFHKAYTKYFYTHTLKYKEHPETNAGLAIENRMLLLKALSSDFPTESKPVIYLSEEEKQKGKDNLSAAGLDPELPIIMCGILGSKKSKSYPAPYMAKLLKKIVLQVEHAQILFNYLPSQQREAKGIFDLCDDYTKKKIFFRVYDNKLRGYIINCASCNVFIGNEGGAANIAKALSIPTFLIFSPHIRKLDWDLYKDGGRNLSVHPQEFSGKEPASYNDLNPEVFQDDLSYFLQMNIHQKSKTGLI